MASNFHHAQSAHCESGVTRNLLQNIGVKQITEPLVFGMGAGLFFIYIPLLKISGGPALAFRSVPGIIFKRTCHSLGIKIIRKKFSSKEKAKEELDKKLSEGMAIGCQVGVYYLPYFPKEYRFHFNAHNIVVFGKEDGKYLISDPIMEYPTTMTDYELERVRFAKGALAPRGQIYYTLATEPVTEERIKRAIIKGIKLNVFHMLKIPGAFAGVKGIAFLGKRIKNWRDKLGTEKAGLYLAQVVRMQEEIGTGGGGFRYMYGAFLQEAYNYFQHDELMKLSEEFTKAGDLWRTAAVQASGIYKGRLGSQQDYNIMGDYLAEISVIEKLAFTKLAAVNKQLK
ncbi:BtrH N-terminal domain-containing protein [Parafilimonas terrae]|uniref:Butirosin biosynthesis protein H, N-terminal n=1 Tax=Parafilimonas terrae TaxID=1465490 RepID=A0A1I5XY92_9BACT|nr:BtrH N-terminal domain-containing protein [Parafilimonas terrae]SFQ36895.1 Butirosin biosynthesis protein H, N-terminal [Parafilimonas terrae]